MEFNIEKIIAVQPNQDVEIDPGLTVTRRLVQPPSPCKTMEDAQKFVDVSMKAAGPLVAQLMHENNCKFVMLSVDKAGNSFTFRFKEPPAKELQAVFEDTVRTLCPVLAAICVDADIYNIVPHEAKQARIGATMTGQPGKFDQVMQFIGGNRTHRLVMSMMWCRDCRTTHALSRNQGFYNESGVHEGPASILNPFFPTING